MNSSLSKHYLNKIISLLSPTKNEEEISHLRNFLWGTLLYKQKII